MTFAARTGAVRNSLPFHTYPLASGGQSRTTSNVLCAARGTSGTNESKLAMPPLSESRPAQPRLHAPGARDGACGEHHTATPQDHPPTQPAARVAPRPSCLSDESARLAGRAGRTE